MAATIEISNCGPIAHLIIPVPENGGICVLRGRNGRGKSKALDAIETAVTGRGKLDVKDGELRGEVEAFGVKLTVGRQTRRSGELVVESLDGRLDVSTLVDPLIKSPEAADGKRIKALVQLAGVLPSAELFWPLVGGRAVFESVVGPSSLDSADLVQMSERIKRDFESAARKEEGAATNAEMRARVSREAAAGADLNAQADPAALHGELEAAIREQSKLTADAESAAKAKRAAQTAKDALEDAESNYSGQSLAEIKHVEKQATDNLSAANRDLECAEQQLARARHEQDKAKQHLAAVVRERQQAEQHEVAVDLWRKQLTASIPEPPAAEAISQAGERVTKARQAVEQGALNRKAQQQLAEAEKSAAEAAKHRKQSDRLREAAKGTDDILSQVVAKSGVPLRVEAGRLVLTTKRGTTYYADLSHGERWKLALDIAIEAVGPKGVLTIPQEAFESLDPIARREIAEHVAGRGVVILTAESSEDEELTAEIFSTANSNGAHA
jgi:hypothetical protein